MGVAAVKKKSVEWGLKATERTEGRAGADTIRLWEGYKEQALLWRAIALLQIPTSFVSILAALIMFFTADTIINVPEKPLPGIYSANELPDAEFINVGIEVVNHIATYTPATASQQFSHVSKLFWEPALTSFKVFRGRELAQIRDTERTQLFLPTEKLIRIERNLKDGTVTARIPGLKQRIVAGIVTAEDTTYYVKMSVVPKNVFNPNGIVVLDLQVSDQTRDDVRKDDFKREREEQKAKNKNK